MAIYHFHMSNVSRKTGGSALATESYITGQTCHDERTGETYNYGRAQRVVERGIMLPAGAPDSWMQRGVMMNAAERECTRKNARTAKKVEASLPVEMSQEQMLDLIRSFAAKLTDKGYGVVWALHTDKEDLNPHVHYEIVNQQIDADGNWIKKWDKSRPAKERTHWLDRKTTLDELRAEWAADVNKALEKAGIDERVDHRSYEDQGNGLTPTQHEGYKARRREAAGHIDPVCEMNRRIRAANDQILARRAVQQAQTLERERLLRMVTEANPDAFIMEVAPDIYQAAIEHFAGRRDVIIASSAEEKQKLETVRASLQQKETDYSDVEREVQSIPQAKVTEVENELTEPTTEGQDDWYERLAESLETGIERVCRWVDREIRELTERLAALTQKLRAWFGKLSEHYRSKVDAVRRSADRRARVASAAAAGREGGRKQRTQSSPERSVRDVIRDLVDAVRGWQPAERESARFVRTAPGRNAAIAGAELTADQIQDSPAAAATRPTTTAEKRAVLEQAKEAFKEVQIVRVMEDHGMRIRTKRRQIDGRKIEVIPMSRHRDIWIGKTGTTYLNVNAGYLGFGGGSAFDFAREYIPEYQELTEQEAIIRFAHTYMPEVLKDYERRAIVQNENQKQGRISFADRLARIRAKKQEENSRDEAREHRTRSYDDWER